MKFELSIQSSSGDYSIFISKGLISKLSKDGVHLMDPVLGKFGTIKSGKNIDIPGSESSKTLDGCQAVILAMKEAGVRRGDTLAAVGGGVVQDVATFVSSIYMRGIDWDYYPSTLTAMADSCIGGKSSINVGGIKNLVGNFYPPKRIFIDPELLATLPRKDTVSGLAEAVKICFARGAKDFETFCRFEAASNPQHADDTSQMILHVLTCKKWFIEVDEFDKKERQLLNFGHSFGHAWEASCGGVIQHGIAVAVGMLAALNHPQSQENIWTEKLQKYCLGLLKEVRDDVEIARATTDWAKFKVALAADKKNSSTELRLILPTSLETEPLRVVSLPLSSAELEIASNAIQTSIDRILN